jgi:hypothetical protein
MLLPDIYHGPAYPYQGYGGLTGDLPIFLSLIAFSMKPERLPQELPRMMHNGEWGTHTKSHGRMFPTLYIKTHLINCPGTDKRGVIVYVYAINDSEEEREELESYEDGSLGKYYN